MTDPRVENLARLLVNYSVAVNPGDKVFLGGLTISCWQPSICHDAQFSHYA